mgnify:CR=1 FL=1
MSKKLAYFIGIIITIVFGSILYWITCCGNQEAGVYNNSIFGSSDSKESIDDFATVNAFSINDSNGDFTFKTEGNFNFNGSNFIISDSVSIYVDEGIEKLKNYLVSDSLKRINITGYFTNQENNTSAFPNLGLARANYVKNYFNKRGIPSYSVNTYGTLNDSLVPNRENTYYGPLLFEISTVSEEDVLKSKAKIQSLGEQIKANPLVLYFDTGKADISLTDEQRTRISNLAMYLDKVQESTIQITGHTDNTGDRFNNIKLGQSRADFVKRYLIGNTIPEHKIQSISKGPDEPLYDNSTEDGRTQNRRTVVELIN